MPGKFGILPRCLAAGMRASDRPGLGSALPDHYGYNSATTGALNNGATNPRGFVYDGLSGSSIEFDFWVLDDVGTIDVSARNLRYDNAWEIIGSNVDGHSQHLLGSDNLEVHITSGLFGGDEMDLIFFPIDENHMNWKQDFSWKK